jgi:uroporphyrinogen-III synthase
MDLHSICRTALLHPKIAAIGPATAAEFLKRTGDQPDLVPDDYVSEAIAEAVGDVEGKRFLLPRADIARKDLAILLREKGAIVDEVAAYRIVAAKVVRDSLPKTCPDYITLTSSQAARSTLDLLRENGLERWFAEAHLVSIGPITSGTVRDLGFEVAAEAADYTAPGLLEALVSHATKEPAHA